MTDHLDAGSVELLDDAVDYINEHGWPQEEYRTKDGRVCAMGAIGQGQAVYLAARLNAQRPRRLHTRRYRQRRTRRRLRRRQRSPAALETRTRQQRWADGRQLVPHTSSVADEDRHSRGVG
ncbi:hypothetical protein GCM10012285_27860 [Streptomyces kronopolitis]|uniref:Uncharacterized protein n=1 Tax=Streptomyces kronopolitis TaxID=1612435 RepID=A0ABQ2JGD3_9ACTN|nr:hypothetical protein GCM10012285_27860 [Streptomyces kronopolitis]